MGKAFHEQFLMLILGKDDRVREAAQAITHIVEPYPDLSFASDPEVYGMHLTPAFQYGIGQADLLVLFKRASLHGKCSRGRSRDSLLVDDADGNTQVPQHERQHQSGRSSTDDEHFGVGCRLRGHSRALAFS
jgi:hypothetical protein